MHFNNFFVPLVTHKSTSYVYISCPCTYFLHTHVNRKKKKRSLTTWRIYHDQSLLVKIDRIKIKTIDGPIKTKTKTQLVGREKKWPTSINVTPQTSHSHLYDPKAVKSDIWAPHLHIVLQIIILAYSSKIALDYTGKNIHALPKL